MRPKSKFSLKYDGKLFITSGALGIAQLERDVKNYIRITKKLKPHEVSQEWQRISWGIKKEC